VLSLILIRDTSKSYKCKITSGVREGRTANTKTVYNNMDSAQQKKSRLAAQSHGVGAVSRLGERLAGEGEMAEASPLFLRLPRVGNRSPLGIGFAWRCPELNDAPRVPPSPAAA
jgi:hypothetical protein